MNLRMMFHTARAAWGNGDGGLSWNRASSPFPSSLPLNPGAGGSSHKNQRTTGYRAVGIFLMVEQWVSEGPPDVCVAGRFLEVGGSKLGEGVLGQPVHIVLRLLHQGDRVQVNLGQLLALCFQILGASEREGQGQLAGGCASLGAREPQDRSVWVQYEARPPLSATSSTTSHPPWALVGCSSCRTGLSCPDYTAWCVCLCVCVYMLRGMA